MSLPPLLQILSLEHRQIAREAGLSPETVSRILRGRQYGSDRTIRSLEAAILRHLITEEVA